MLGGAVPATTGKMGWAASKKSKADLATITPQVRLSYQGQFFRQDMQAHFGAVRFSYSF
jgi:hypothetical protein